MLLSIFQDITSKYADRVCLVDAKFSKEFTYLQLYNYVKQIAFKLKKNGIQRFDYVTIELPNSIEYFASRFAVWMLGAAIVCLSDKTPDNRKNFIKNHCNPKFAITADFFDDIDFDSEMIKEDEIIIPDKLDDAVIIYTSGTTGTPKGVLHSFQSINQIHVRNSAYGYEPFLHHASFPSVEFIASFEDVSALLSLHVVYIVPAEIKLDVNLLSEFIDKYEINKMFFFSQLVQFLHPKKNTLKSILCAGAKASNVYSDKFTIYNNYGTSEIGPMTVFTIDKEYDNTPVGKTLSNEKIYILDKDGNKANKGEMYFAGYMAKGYLNNPEETKRSFIDNPFKSEDGFDRLYKTGDVGELLEDGNLVYLYRTDFMVKINGQRVEPGEVEIIINEMEELNDACVKAFEDDGSTYLCAYYVADSEITTDYFINHLSKYMRSYMIPSHFVKIAKIPRNVNGKIAYSELKKPEAKNARAKYVAPTNQMEKLLCDSFSKIFKIDKIGIDDSFVDLGGDSIMAIEIQSYVPNLNFSILTKHKTPRNIAKVINELDEQSVTYKYSISTGTPLTKSQRIMYYSGLLLENHSPNYVLYDYSINKKKNITEVKNIIYKLIQKHPILKARLGQKDNKPWIYYDGQPLITSYERIASLDIRVAMSSFAISDDKISCIFHHHIMDFVSTKIIKKDLDALFNDEEIHEDLLFLKVPEVEEDAINTPEAKNSSMYLDEVFKDYDMTKSPFYFPKSDNAMVVCKKFSLDTNNMFLLAKHLNIPVGICFMAAYSQLMAAYTYNNDVAFGYMTFGRDYNGFASGISYLANRYILRANKYNFSSIEEYLVYFYDLFEKTTSNSLWNALEIENKFSVHTDLYFNYFDMSGNSSGLDQDMPESFILNTNTTREFMTTLHKNNDDFRMEFLAPAYINKDLVNEFFENYVFLIDAYNKNEVDFNQLNSILSEKATHKYNKLTNEGISFDQSELTQVENKICESFKTVFSINGEVSANDIDFKKLNGSLEDAIDILYSLRLNGLFTDMPPLDIVRLKKPCLIAAQILKLQHWKEN